MNLDLTIYFATIAITLLVCYVHYLFTYWERRGVPAATFSSFPLGHFSPVILQRCSIGHLMEQFYRSTTAPFVGVFAFFRPILIVRDPMIIKSILIKDFSHFESRGVLSDENVDVLSTNLVQVDGEKWRALRPKLSPGFTTAKLKALIPTSLRCIQPVFKHLEKFADTDEAIEIRDLMARYAVYTTSAAAFGIEVNCIDNRNDELCRQVRSAFAPTVMNGFRQMMTVVAPQLARMLKIRTFDKRVYEFLVDIVEQNLEYRESSPLRRTDYFQMLLRCFRSEKNNFSMNDLVGQSFMFYAAGLESTSTSVSFCLYELAKNPDIQKRLFDEIQEVVGDEDPNYNMLADMEYLNCCLEGQCKSEPREFNMKTNTHFLLLYISRRDHS